MWIVYEGSLPRPAVPQLRGVEIVRGEPVEVPDEIGAALLEQRSWRSATPVVHDETKPYSELTVAELRKRAEALGLSVPARTPKAEIITLIEGEEERQAAQQPPDEENDDE
jgi:hypothetical protein